MSAPRLSTVLADRAAARSTQRRRAALEICRDARQPLRVIAARTGYAETGALRQDVRSLVAEGLMDVARGRTGGFTTTERGRASLSAAPRTITRATTIGDA